MNELAEYTKMLSDARENRVNFCSIEVFIEIQNGMQKRDNEKVKKLKVASVTSQRSFLFKKDQHTRARLL